MPNDLVNLGGYIPLVAGAELVRRSGALTQFPSANYLGNLPDPGIWLDEFPADFKHNILSHSPSIGTSYASANTLQYVYPAAEGTHSDISQAIDWYNSSPIDVATSGSKTSIEFYVKMLSFSYDFRFISVSGVSGGSIASDGAAQAFRVNAGNIYRGNTVIGTWPYDVGNVVGSLIEIDPVANKITGNFMGIPISYTPLGGTPVNGMTFHFGNYGLSMTHLRVFK